MPAMKLWSMVLSEVDTPFDGVHHIALGLETVLFAVLPRSTYRHGKSKVLLPLGGKTRRLARAIRTASMPMRYSG